MKEEFLRQIEDLDWDSTYQKLEAFSLSLAKLYFKNRWRNLPKGYTYEDVVQRAIKLAFEKEWDIIDAVIFEDYLFGAIKSIFWGLVISGDNRKTKPLSHSFVEESDTEFLNGSKEAVNGQVDLNHELDFKVTLDLIQTEISAKPNSNELHQVFSCIREGLEPRQIVERTGISEKKVTNCKRQLLTIVDKISKYYK